MTSKEGSVPKEYIKALDVLRGMAAVSVCFYHFACGNSSLLPAGDWLKFCSSFGWLGVQCFFVISGFVIPYAMSKRKFRLKDASRFLYRRAIRIEPPYIVSILLILALNYCSSLAPGFQGKPFEFSLSQLFSHLFYLNSFSGIAWYNPVYWTLGIEFQYYISIALLFPLLNANGKKLRMCSLICIASIGLISDSTEFLIYWLPLFCMGIVVFQYKAQQVNGKELAILVMMFAVMVAYRIGYLQAVVGAVTALLIVRPAPLNSGWVAQRFAMVGTISYSLYLIHVPVGGRVINLGMRLSDSMIFRYGLVFLALAVSLMVAYIFWLIVERPVHELSKRIGCAGVAESQC